MYLEGWTTLRWIELNIIVKTAEVEAVASIMGPFGQGGTAIEEWQNETDPEKIYKIKAYLPHSRSYKEQKRQIELRLSQLPGNLPLSLEERLLKPEDWLDSLKKHFGLLEVGEKFIIKPSWENIQSVPSEHFIIELDPGAAFGTGLHQTTRLCLIHLEKNLLPGMSVFDLGTGTGILAIAAARLGASSVLAVDIDPVAVKVAKTNAAVNGVSNYIHIRRGSLSLRTQRVERNAFDLVLANITSRTISDLSKAMFRVLKPGGKLIVSGIHPQGLDEVLISLALAGFKLEKIDNQDEWYAVISQKPE
jgi:ribosomal protein L11 methyltransferase